MDKIELRPFQTQMARYREFLNQSKTFRRIDIIKAIYLIKTEGFTVEDNKNFFLSEFTELIFSNGLNFKQISVESDFYGRYLFTLNFIRFEIENITEIEGIYSADVIFNLKGGRKKTLKYEYFDELSFDRYYDEFKFVDGDEEIFYRESYEEKGNYRIILNDLFLYLDFVGSNFYNKSFVQPEIRGYDYESFLRNENGTYEDKNWQIDKSDFIYVDATDEFVEPENINDLTDNQLFNYALSTYYQEHNAYQLPDKIFKVIEYLDMLIEKKYPMAFLTKAILHIDGKIVFKDLFETRQLLKKAYSLGLFTPSLLIWNENRL